MGSHGESAFGEGAHAHRLRMRLPSSVQSSLLAVFAAAAFGRGAGRATTLDDLVAAVVRIKTFINPDGTSVSNLGREREGSGIVIDESGLILTIGYLMVEAHAAEIVTNAGRTVPATVVGYDHETGFGLLRTIAPLKIKPLAFGKSADLKSRIRCWSRASAAPDAVQPVHVASRREFAGSWEYLVESAIFTAPPHPAWSGAALINREGKLVGVGSLIVGDASGDNDAGPGNMFVPIDLLDADPRRSARQRPRRGAGRPWLGVNAQAVHGRLFVGRVTPGSPAEQAGLKRGDVIVGVAARRPGRWRISIASSGRWAPPAPSVPLDVMSDGETRRVDVKSVNRLDTLSCESMF